MNVPDFPTKQLSGPVLTDASHNSLDRGSSSALGVLHSCSSVQFQATSFDFASHMLDVFEDEEMREKAGEDMPDIEVYEGGGSGPGRVTLGSGSARDSSAAAVDDITRSSCKRVEYIETGHFSLCGEAFVGPVEDGDQLGVVLNHKEFRVSLGK